ncbi:hypothetical protein ABPG77_001721 [Micractinium sp. CCAP 211/92]
MASSFVDEQSWSPQDWKWDSYNLKAEPNDAPPAKGSGGKAARATAADGAKQGCQVDGCTIEVGGQKDYHSRYKICEFHLKAPVVQKEGRPHRFCQQCGKFQPLEDFDGDKRSCRARLEKHNARRRRQREMAHMLKKTGTIDEKLLAEKYGMKGEEIAPKVARLAKAGKPSTSAGSPTGTATGANKARSAATQSVSPAATEGVGVSGSMHGTAAAARASAAAEADAQAELLMQQLQAQQEALDKAQQAAALLQAQQAAAAAFAPGGAAPMLEDALLGMSSSEPMLTGVANAVRDAAPPVPAPLGAAGPTNLHLLLDDEFLEEVFTPMLDGLVGAAGAAGVPPSAAAAAFLQMDAASAMDLDDMAGLEQLAEQLMPGLAPAHRMDGGPGATWPQATPTAPSGERETFGAAGLAPPPYVTQSVLQASQPLGPGGFPGSLLGATPFTGGLQPPPPLPGAHLRGLGLGSRVESPPSSHSTSTSAMQRGMSGSVLDEALNLLSYDSAQVTYVPEEKLVRFSAKLFNCTPAQLPSDLKASLVNMLSCQSMEGYLRPGCVHITVNALIGPEERQLLAQSGVRAVVERLVARQPQAFWSQHAMLVQLGDKLALVREGRVVHVLATAHSSLFPRVAALRPLVAEPAADGAVEVSVWGFNLDIEADTLLARTNGSYLEVERVRLEADPAWNGMQRLDLRLAGASSPGAVQIEVMRGGYISGSKAMLLTPDRQLAAEVRALEAEEAPGDVDTLLFQLANCKEWVAGAGRREFTPEDREVLGKSSRRLLAFAVQRKWVAATRTLLSSVAADQPAEEAMAAIDVMCVGTTGMPLLQLAVRSQQLELVQAVLEWGDAHGYTFKSTTPGRRGLTALHLAGLVNDGGAIAGLVSEKCADALEGWERAGAEDGSLPIQFARHTGAAAVVERLIALHRFEAASKAAEATKPCPCACGPEGDAAAPPGPAAVGVPAGATKATLVHRGIKAAGDSASSSRTPSKDLVGAVNASLADGDDQIAAAKAAVKARRAEERAQDSLLRFRNPELESRYQSWHSAGQVPVDIAFLVIATLSQGAWVFRWSASASWLGAAMVGLLLMNAAAMQVAVLFPGTYIKWREPLCVWSHVAHKLAQTAVTLLPPVGTIFSPSYNPTVALLESSSLAQIHMLSFGMKLRFGTHLAVDLFHLAAAMVANGQVCAKGFPLLPGAACNALMVVWQALACFALPSALVYASEKRSRRIFLETVSD